MNASRNGGEFLFGGDQQVFCGYGQRHVWFNSYPSLPQQPGGYPYDPGTSRSGIIPLSGTQDVGGPIGRSVTDIAIVLDVIAGYDPADPQTAASVGNIPKSYTDYLQIAGLRGARIGLLTDLLGSEPEEAEVAKIVRQAIKEMNGQGAQVNVDSEIQSS